MTKVENLVFDLFKGKDIFLVGGYVRDKLLGYESHDLDFATRCRPEETFDILTSAGYKPHTVGWAFGTVGFIHDSQLIQITTYRKDENYQRDNRHPVVEWGDSILDDLKRRDFTINAIAIDREGNIIDPFNGKQALNQQIIETPIGADQAFTDDPLRILRAVRFRCRFGFYHSLGVEKALHRQSYRVLTLPKERILEEMNKILVTDNPDIALTDMVTFKIINYIIPELLALRDLKQDSKYHYKDAWEHTITVVKNITNDSVLRWAALFHDIGKPYTMSEIAGEVHFFRHEEVSAFMAESILKRLGLPSKWIRDIVFLVRNHMPANLYTQEWGDSAICRFVRKMGAMLPYIFELSRSDISSHKLLTIEQHLGELADLEKRCNNLKEYQELKCPVDGVEIMECFKIQPGPLVGTIKTAILDAIMDGLLTPHEEKSVYFDYAKENVEELRPIIEWKEPKGGFHKMTTKKQKREYLRNIKKMEKQGIKDPLKEIIGDKLSLTKDELLEAQKECEDSGSFINEDISKIKGVIKSSRKCIIARVSKGALPKLTRNRPDKGEGG